jgi:Protein of unknown function (DUF2934)
MAKKRNTSSPGPMAVGGAAPARIAPEKMQERESTKTTDTRPETSLPQLSNNRPDPEAVARLAYSYWLERGGAGGSSEEDWLRAERELSQNRTASASA